MTIFDTTAPAAPTTLHVRTVPGLPVSVRIVTTPTSTLAIGAAPWRHARRLAALPLFSGACLYVLTGSEARIGKTTGLDQRHAFRGDGQNLHKDASLLSSIA